MNNVFNAVKYVCNDDNFKSLSRRDAGEAKEWLASLTSLHYKMQQVRRSLRQSLRLPSRCLSMSSRLCGSFAWHLPLTGHTVDGICHAMCTPPLQHRP